MVYIMSLVESMKIRLLKEKVKAYRRAAHEQGKFSLFDAKFATDMFSKGTNYDYLNWNYEVILDYDGEGFITKVRIQK